MAEKGPMGYCIQTFRVVPKKDDAGNPGFVAVWVLGARQRAGALGKKPEACTWKPTRQLVLQAMVNLYADIAEYGKQGGDGENY
jgi:hypothetical protein